MLCLDNVSFAVVGAFVVFVDGSGILFFYSNYSGISSTFCLVVVHSTAPTLFSLLHTLEAQSAHISCILSVAIRLGSYKPTFTLDDRPFEFLFMPLVLSLRVSHVEASVMCLSIEDGQPAWSFSRFRP
jgi:hypothetical protein